MRMCGGVDEEGFGFLITFASGDILSCTCFLSLYPHFNFYFNRLKGPCNAGFWFCAVEHFNFNKL